MEAIDRSTATFRLIESQAQARGEEGLATRAQDILWHLEHGEYGDASWGAFQLSDRADALAVDAGYAGRKDVQAWAEDVTQRALQMRDELRSLTEAIHGIRRTCDG